MANLLTSFLNSANSLDAFGRGLSVVQNNVANSSTPGYAKQTQTFETVSFGAGADGGGVRAGQIDSARDEYAEAAVRRSAAALGMSKQKVDSLGSIEALFGVDGQSGIAGGISNLLQSFSNWSSDPNGAIAKQNVVSRGSELAQSFQITAKGLLDARSETDSRLQAAVSHVNQTVNRIRDLSIRRGTGSMQDQALDAQMHSELEDLAQYGDVSVSEHGDGQITVIMGGQVPLLVGANAYALKAAPGNAAASVLSGQGQDLTASFGSGILGGLLDVRNRALPAIMGQLDGLAAKLGGDINGILTDGQLSAGPPPVAAPPMFTFNAANPAATIQVAQIFDPQSLAPLDATTVPASANGIPNRLVALGGVQAINGQQLTYTEAYGQTAAWVGDELNNARSDNNVDAGLLAQAKDARQQTSGVSLDEEAAKMLQYQRSYEAASRMVRTLSDLTEEAINLIR